jgi:GcrA cell cycle regulator
MNALVPLSLMRPAEARVDWTDEAIETAKRLSANGWSAGEIARKMSAEHPGISRNAVIGKLHRMGCAGGGRQPNKDKDPGPHSIRTAQRVAPVILGRMLAPTKPSPRVGQGVRERSEKRGAFVDRSRAAPSMRLLTIVELGQHDCRWPIGDPSSEEFRYCGALSDERPYCPYHCRIAYGPTMSMKNEGLKCQA